MKQLNLKKILDAIKQARYEHSKGILNPDIKNSTNLEFWSQTRNSNLRKQQLIQLAKSKQPRPSSRKHPLGCSFNNYINTNSQTFDPFFTKQIKELAPHWFVPRSTIANQKKQQLIQLAKSKQPRPNSRKHPLGCLFNSYINPTHGSYDPKFTKQIKELAPHWFKK